MPLKDFKEWCNDRKNGTMNTYTIGELSKYAWVEPTAPVAKSADQTEAVQKAGFDWETGNSKGQEFRAIASKARQNGDMDAVDMFNDYADTAERIDCDSVYSISDEPSIADNNLSQFGYLGTSPAYTIESVDEYNTPQQYADVAQGADASAKLQAIIKEYGPEMVQNALASFGKSAESAEADSSESEESEEDVSEDIQKSESPDTFSQVVQELHNRGYTGEQIGQAFTAIIKSAINGSDGNLETAFSAMQKSVSQPDEAPTEPAETIQ